METQGKLNVEFPDLELLQRFDVPGPRYTSYPTADRFTKEFGAEDFKKVLNARGTGENTADLSLYVHIPFCANVCFFCGCNKEVTKDHCRSKEYLEVLSKECELVSAEIGGNKEVVQLHFGGGSPTFLNNEEIFQVMDIIRSHFALAPDAEISIEVDPRSTPVDKVEVLAKAGFNRMSIGVQDFDNRVQIAVNRVQPFEMTKAVLDAARANGFKSINMDLIYGLPFQSRKTFEMTLDKVIELSPDRIALYHFAHLPEHFKPQRRINAEDLPSTPEKVGIMMDAIKRLSATKTASLPVASLTARTTSPRSPTNSPRLRKTVRCRETSKVIPLSRSATWLRSAFLLLAKSTAAMPPIRATWKAITQPSAAVT